MTSPLVSIIIPTYNRACFIGETLDSVILQTYQKWECIVVDDGSSDYTYELMEFYCEKDSRIQYHNRPSNKPKGANACRNYGFKISKGEYINWLDSDDILFLNNLEAKLKINSSKYDLIISFYIYGSNNLGFLRTNKFSLFQQNLFLSYIVDNFESQIHALLWKRNFLKKSCLFDETLSRYQDNDFNLRMFYRNPNYLISQNNSGIVRGGENHGISSLKEQNFSEKFSILKYRFYSNTYLDKYLDKYKNIPFHDRRLVYKKTIWAYYRLYTNERLLRKLDIFRKTYYYAFKIITYKYATLQDRIKFLFYSFRKILFL